MSDFSWFTGADAIEALGVVIMFAILGKALYKKQKAKKAKLEAEKKKETGEVGSP